MRIVFDAYELILGQGKSIGIYNYAKNLLKALAQRIDQETEIIVICNSANIADFETDHPAVKCIVISKTAPDKFSRLHWFFWQAALNVKKLNADIYFSPKGFLPFGIRLVSPKIKTIIVIHDLIPLWYAEHYPGYFGYFEELFINNSIVSTIKRVDRVIAISQATADDIRTKIGSHVAVSKVHNGISIGVPAARQYAEPYIFAMASQLPHKNADGVLAAYRVYRQLVETPLPLIICGISEPNQAGVIALKGLNDQELHAYYANARLFVFLSLIEGFGFPPVEALAHGTQVLCSDIPALREVAKDLADYIDPSDPEAAGRKMAELLNLTDSADLKNNRIKIRDEFTWIGCANGILTLIENL